MQYNTFSFFLDNKKKQTIRQLKLIKDILVSGDLEAKTFFNDRTPYIFCKSSVNNSELGGIRVYKIGDVIAFRAQDEPEGLSYGSAYTLPIESMFAEYMSEDSDQIKAGKKIIKNLILEIKSFFDKSSEAAIEIIPKKRLEIKLLDKDLKNQEFSIKNK